MSDTLTTSPVTFAQVRHDYGPKAEVKRVIEYYDGEMWIKCQPTTETPADQVYNLIQAGATFLVLEIVVFTKKKKITLCIDL